MQYGMKKYFNIKTPIHITFPLAYTQDAQKSIHVNVHNGSIMAWGSGFNSTGFDILLNANTTFSELWINWFAIGY